MTWPAHVHHGNNTVYDGPADPSCFICHPGFATVAAEQPPPTARQSYPILASLAGPRTIPIKDDAERALDEIDRLRALLAVARGWGP